MGSDSFNIDFISNQSVAFDVEAFDEAIMAHGTEFIHYRAMRNPVGMVDKYDSRRPDQDLSDASNGMIYTKAGCLRAIMTGNTKDVKNFTGGLLDAGTAQITAPRFYDDGESSVYLAPFDRLFLKEDTVLVRGSQFNNVTAQGIDRLKFPLAQVLDLVDADNIRYSCGKDFTLNSSGNIVWRDTGPKIGKVYSCTYLYRPHWYVDHLSHEIRIVQNETIYGERTMVKMPQTAIVQREYVFRNEFQDSESEDSPRKVAPPEEGSFGPR